MGVDAVGGEVMGRGGGYTYVRRQCVQTYIISAVDEFDLQQTFNK